MGRTVGGVGLPNGGLAARFTGLYIPILDLTFNGPEPTDTQFDTVVITRQYDGAADFPLYPLNVIADLNAVLGFFYLHSHPFDVSLAPDSSTSTAFQGTHGDTSYYFFETQDLPLFAPLRMLGVPEALIDVVEPVFRVLVERGYDRTIPPWEPTPARLIPPLDPEKVIADLGDAISDGMNNAAGLTGSSLPLSIPMPAQTTTTTESTSDQQPAETTGSTSNQPTIDTEHPTPNEQPSEQPIGIDDSTPSRPTVTNQRVEAASADDRQPSVDASPQANGTHRSPRDQARGHPSGGDPGAGRHGEPA